MEFKILKREQRYKGFFSIDALELQHSLFRGDMSQTLKREMIGKGEAAAILLYDPKLRKLVLVEQFRIGAMEDKTGPWLTELVAGYIEPGESAEDVVRREAIEEAGCTVQDIFLIGQYYVSPGSTSEKMTLFCGCVDASNVGGIYGLEEEGEDIRVKVADVADAMAMLQTGEIDSATPWIGMLWLQSNEHLLQEKWG